MKKKKATPCAMFLPLQTMRFSDGGAAGVSPAAEEKPAPAAPAEPENKPDSSKPPENGKRPEQTVPAAAQPSAVPPSYTEQQLQEARDTAVEEYKRHQLEAQDYEKMTPEEKVVFLERQAAEEKLGRYAAECLTAASLPVGLAKYIRAADEKGADTEIKQLKALYDTGIQAGVEARFRRDGYTPRTAGAGAVKDAKPGRVRGVSVE